MTKKGIKIKTYFSDFFEVEPNVIEDYGAFNISLINDLPLFIDPFLLFNSKDQKYSKLHQDIIDYLLFLKNISSNSLSEGDINNYFRFPEVKQTWLGYSKNGNSGSGLGKKFANGLSNSFKSYLSNFGNEQLTSAHLEKVCLFDTGIGKDNISDFTTNLIVGYLAEYTENFAKKYINKKFLKQFAISKYKFNYKTQSWESKTFELPYLINPKGKSEYVLLTPKNILTKNEQWINNTDKIDNFDAVLNSISDDQMRAQINRYFASILKKDARGRSTKKDYKEAKQKTYQEYPELIDLYIRYKEKDGKNAILISDQAVNKTKEIFYDFAKEITQKLSKEEYYGKPNNSFNDIRHRLLFFKDWVENKGGWKLFYNQKRLITNEPELQLLFKLTHIDSEYDINSEVDNGSGSVDFTTSKGSKDKAIVEFKLAKNSKFKQNSHPLGQVRKYEKSNGTKKSIKVFFCFSKEEVIKVQKYIADFQLNQDQVLTINCAQQQSASNINPYEFDDWDKLEMESSSFDEIRFE